jgi:uncharacterized protein
MATNKIRVVIDPNIIGSVLIGGLTRKRYLLLLAHLDQLELCYSDKVLEEVRHFAEVDFFKKKNITPATIENFLATFQEYALKVMVTSHVKLGRDKNDYFLLSLCRDARAKYLTTGDPDLLLIRQYANTQIVSMKNFCETFSIAK